VFQRVRVFRFGSLSTSFAGGQGAAGLLVEACACSRMTRWAVEALGEAAVGFANMRLAWRGRGFYASGTPEVQLAASADLSALQSLVGDAEFPSRLAE